MASVEPLKPREIEILRLLAEGLSDRAIASRLGLRAETVKWHNKRIYARLEVSSRIQAVRVAIAKGILSASVPALPSAVVTRSPIRYLRRDGTYIAYQVVGDGPIDLVFIHGFISHLEQEWEEPECAAFFERLGRACRLFIFDRRGVGLSDRIAHPPTLEDTVEDVRAILAAEGSSAAFVLGTSEGGAAAIVLASVYPESVRGLLLLGSTAKVARDGDLPEWSRPHEAFAQNIALIESSWGGPYGIERFAPSRAQDPAFRDWWSRALRAASSPSAARRVLEAAALIDVRPLLPHVHARALVMHRRDDALVPVEAGRFLAEQMPNADFLELPGGDHIFFVDGERVADAVVRFIAEPTQPPMIDSWVAILLVCAGPPVTISDEQRRILQTFGARDVRTTPTGWQALFEGPHRAVRAAVQLRGLGRGRIGALALHVGSCRRSDGLPTEETLGRVTAMLAETRPASVTVSTTLRDILIGDDIRLTRGSGEDWTLAE